MILIFILLILFTLSACIINNQNSDIKTIKIWVIAPISWPAADYGIDWVNTYKYLVDKFNFENKNIQIKLIIEDGKCNGKDSTSAAQKLININNVQIIMWGSCSSETLAAGKLAQQHGIVLMDSVASAPAISNIGDFVFKYINDNYAGKTLSKYASKILKSIVLVYDDTDYGVALANVIRKNYQWIIVSEIKVSIDEKDLSIVAKNIKKSNPDGIIVIDQDYTSAISKIKAFEKEWLLKTHANKIISAYFYSSNTFLNAVGNLIQWAHQVDVPLVNNLWIKAEQFIQDFEKIYSVRLVASYIIFQWEAMNVIMDAILSWNYDSQSIKNYLRNINKSNPREWIFWNYYFEGSDVIWIPYVIQEIKNNKPIIIE